jgi:hypothetical protein
VRVTATLVTAPAVPVTRTLYEPASDACTAGIVNVFVVAPGIAVPFLDH